jgi:hypothetical protein
LHSLKKIKEERDLTGVEAQLWLDTKELLDDIYLEEESYWKARSKDQWLREGDLNTSYFHKIASNRKKKNLILNMEIDGEQCESLPLIEAHIINYYKQLFGEAPDKQARLNSDFWEHSYLISESDRMELEKSFTELELKEAVFGSEASGAPGPDGFSFMFYRHFWMWLRRIL